MDLQISVFLLFLLFTAGHSLDCYKCLGLTGSCADQKLITCPSGSSMCISSTAVPQGQISLKVMTKDCAPACQSGSMNIGITRISTACCNTDQCNAQDVPDLFDVPNGKKCYTCDGQNCTNTVSCSATEDYCIKATATAGGQSVVVKGCVSKSICDDKESVPNVKSISCCEGNLCNCEGNLCNGAQSVTQSFLFLCCSLLSYFLLH